jgi:hypothetical protein
VALCPSCCDVEVNVKATFNYRLQLLLLVVAACVCGGCTSGPRDGSPSDQPHPTALPANAGLVTPPNEDLRDAIVSWVDGQEITEWPAEIAKRERAIDAYLNDTDPVRADKYGFRSGHHPRLAWDWFRNNPVGFNGLPFVLLKTILDLDPNHTDPALRTIARIWKREAVVPGAVPWTIDHIGVAPNPVDYVDGVARPVDRREEPLPSGLAFENPRTFEPLSAAEMPVYDGRLLARRVFRNSSLLIATIQSGVREDNWERDRPNFGSPGTLDRVFLSCAACHVGRVAVSGRIKFLPGMPNTEIEAQYFSKLIMLTAAVLVESGFDSFSNRPVNPSDMKANTRAIGALYTEMLDKAQQRPETLYGKSPTQIARGKIQVLAVADEFPSVVQDLIGAGVKTHFIYHVVAKNNAYSRPSPDVFEDRPGQIDAFGIMSGLTAIHTRRPDNSFLEYVRRDNANNPILSGFSKANGLPVDVPGMTDAVTDPRVAGDRIFKNIRAWAPEVPAAIDVKSVNWTGDRYHGNWDGNQSVSASALSSGAFATGEPRSVNVRVHEPFVPFTNNLPPPPYPFHSVDLARAREGKALFRKMCTLCHTPRNQRIYPVSTLGVDPNRTLVNTSVSRFGLAALLSEACTIFGLNNQGQRGWDWCVPQGDWQARLDEYFRDTPRRVAEGTNGYKADMLHGIWAQGPYLHNGSVPTLGQLLCPDTRPRRFLRGNLHYDEALVGFEWSERPKARYGPNDTILIKEYDTTLPGHHNSGHRFGMELCPDTSGLDPIRDRTEIETRVVRSPVGALLAYLKTL